jgi:hypothetical protein
MRYPKLKIPVTPQTEGHTCGFCAAHSIYRYYGLDPDARLIREYMGTDHLLPYKFPGRAKIEHWLGGVDHLLSGTSPMDMLAVMYWDGFDTEIHTGKFESYAERLLDHLTNGDPAIAMMYSCYHWVVISGLDKHGVWVVDGCFTGRDINEDSKSRSHTYRIPFDLFAEELHGMIFVSRDVFEEDEMREMSTPDFIREYTRGVKFCAGVLGRKIPAYISKLLPSTS